MADLDLEVVNRLAAAGLGLTAGVNLFRGKVQPADTRVPARAVFVLLLSGEANAPYMGNASDWQVHSVQVRVRADAEDFAGGQQLGRAVVAALHRAALPSYAFTLVDSPAAEPIGHDAQSLPEWSLHCRAGTTT
jgi:uncharacterized protein DUF3168